MECSREICKCSFSKHPKQNKVYKSVSKNSLIVEYLSCGYSSVPFTPDDDSISKYVWSPFMKAEYIKSISKFVGKVVAAMPKKNADSMWISCLEYIYLRRCFISTPLKSLTDKKLQHMFGIIHRFCLYWFLHNGKLN